MFGDLSRDDQVEATAVTTTELQGEVEAPTAVRSPQLGASLESSLSHPTQLDSGPILVTVMEATMGSGDSPGKTESDHQGRGEDSPQLLLVDERPITSEAVADKVEVPSVIPTETKITTTDWQGNSLSDHQGLGREMSELPPLCEHPDVTSAEDRLPSEVTISVLESQGDSALDNQDGVREISELLPVGITSEAVNIRGEVTLETTMTPEDLQRNTTLDGDGKDPETTETVSVVEPLKAGNIRDELPLVTLTKHITTPQDLQGQISSDGQGTDEEMSELLPVDKHPTVTSETVNKEDPLTLVTLTKHITTPQDLQGQISSDGQGTDEEMSELLPVDKHPTVTSETVNKEDPLTLVTLTKHITTPQDLQGQISSDGQGTDEEMSELLPVDEHPTVTSETVNKEDPLTLVTFTKHITTPQDLQGQISSDGQGTDEEMSELLPVDEHPTVTSEAVNKKDPLTLATRMKTTTPEDSQDKTTTDNQDTDHEIAEASSIVETVTVTLESFNIRDEVPLVTPKGTITTPEDSQGHIPSSDQDRGRELSELLLVDEPPNITLEAEFSLVIPMEPIITPEGETAVDDQGSDREMPELSPFYPNVPLEAENIRDELPSVTAMETTSSSGTRRDSEDSESLLVLGHHNFATENPDNQDTWSVTTDEFMSEPDEESDEDTKADHVYKLLAKLKTEEIDLEDPWDGRSVQLSEIEPGNNRPAQAVPEVIYQRCPDIICSYEGKVAVDLSHHKRNRADVADEVPDMGNRDDTSSFDAESSDDSGVFKCASCDYETPYQYNLPTHESRCHFDIATSPFQYNQSHKLHCYLCQFRTGLVRYMTQHLRLCHTGASDYYSCPECPFSTGNIGDLRRHRSIGIHGIQPTDTQCTKCLYKSSSDLEDHKRRCHFGDVSSLFEYDENYKFYCHLCDYRSVSIQVMTQHLRICHDDLTTYYYCMICPFSTSEESELERHRSSDIHRQGDSSKFQCTKCFYQSPFEASLKNHTDRCHPADSSSPFQYRDSYKFHCHLCQYRSFLIHGIVQHLSTCHRDSTTYYYCQTCPFSTSDGGELERHISEFHQGAIVTKPITYKASTSMFRPITCINNMYQCGRCYYQSEDKMYVENHIDRCHPDDSPSPFQYMPTYKFLCPFCQYRSQLINTMGPHLKDCHRDLTTYYYCTSCSFNTSDESELESHNSELHQVAMSKAITDAANTSTFACDKCNYQSSRQANLDQHLIRCHPDDSPTPFQYNETYKLHCHLCQYRAMFPKIMQQHLKKCHRDSTACTGDDRELEHHNLEPNEDDSIEITCEVDTSTYQCDKCFYQSTQKGSLKDHIDRCHPDDSPTPFQYNETYKLHCHLCQYQSQESFRMAQHLSKCHSKVCSFYCTLCPFSTSDESELKRHKSEDHQGATSTAITYEADTSTYQCYKCFYQAAQEVHVKDHINRCHPDDSPTPFEYSETYKLHCHLCQYRAMGPKIMEQHLTKCHRDLTTYFYCTTCPFSTSVESELERHNSKDHQGATAITYETDTSTYQCNKCFYQAAQQVHVKDHINRCHPDDSPTPFQYNESYKLHCDSCQYRAMFPKTMEQHLTRCHKNSTACTGGDDGELEQHNLGPNQDDSNQITCEVETHTYQCNECHYCSPYRASLADHKDRCHPDDSSSPFQYNYSFKIHCHLCQYRSQGIFLMTQHLSKCHRDLTTYFYCTICPFSTSDESELKRHNSERHQGFTPRPITYAADTSTYQCDKSQLDRPQLKKLRTTTISRQLQSDNSQSCSKCFFQSKSNMSLHKKRCHPDDSSAPFPYNEAYKFHCHLCQYRSEGIIRMGQHLKKCHRDLTTYYYCPGCRFSTSDRAKFDGHNSELHDGTMSSPITYANETNIGNTYFYCEVCSFRTRDESEIERHKSEFHQSTTSSRTDSSKYQCDKCRYQTSKKLRLVGHIDRCHPDDSSSPFKYNENYVLRCHLCQHRAFAAKKMVQHLRVCHETITSSEQLQSDSNYQCYYRSHKATLADHKNRCDPDDSPTSLQYNETSKLHCHLCQYRSQGIVAMAQHLSKSHGDLTTYFYCTLCPFSTSDESELERHHSELHQGATSRPITYEADISTYQCGKCFYQSARKVWVENHIDRCHFDDSPIPLQYNETYKLHCHLCQYRSQGIVAMAQHLTKCHRDFTTYFYCTTCPFSTSDESELERHNSELHHGATSRPITYEADTSTYHCDKCFHRSEYKMVVEDHIDRCHPDDSPTPFQYNETSKLHCHLCQFRSQAIVGMTKHLTKCHRDSTTYFYCTLCPFSTSDESELERHHSELHQGVTSRPITYEADTSTYQCDKCFYRCGYKMGVEDHIDRCHPDDSPTPFQYNETSKLHCHLCQFRSQGIVGMTKHLTKCHRDSTTYFYCTRCPFSISDESELERHHSELHQGATSRTITYEADTSMYQCDKCFYQFARKVCVENHIDRCHFDDSPIPFQYNETYKLHCHLCQYRSQGIVAIAQHLSKCHRDFTTYFYCTTCPFSTSDESELERHKSEDHQGATSTTITYEAETSTYQCNKCFYQSAKEVYVKNHINRCHPDDSLTPFQYNKTYKLHCHLCQYRSLGIVAMAQHLIKCHRDSTTYFYCTLCPFSTSDESELERHRLKKHRTTAISGQLQIDNSVRSCSKCFFQSKTNMRLHKNRCHPDDSSAPFPYNEAYKFHCHLCQYRSEGIVLMGQHLKKCHRDSTTYYYCPGCRFSTSDKTKFDSHNSELHDGTMSSPITYEANIGNTFFYCDVCSFRTMDESELERHKSEFHQSTTSTRTDPSRYQCDKCRYQTNRTLLLKSHIDRCHPDVSSSPFKYKEIYALRCHLCQYRAIAPKKMVQHLRVCHELEDHETITTLGRLHDSKYQCAKCDFQARFEVNLKRHKNRCHFDDLSTPFPYTDLYKFHCPMCQYRAQLMTTMVQHLKSCHRCSTTYLFCTTCAFSTSDETELERHNSELHLGARPITYEADTSTYQCDKCFYQSGHKISVDNHIDRCHPDDSPTPFQYNESTKLHCHLCQFRSQGMVQMTKHLTKCHRDWTTYFYCTLCPFSTSDESELERHNSELHHGARPITYEADTSTYQCDNCFYQSGHKISVENHIDHCHPDDSPTPFQYNETSKLHCHLCQFRSQGMVQMTQHLTKCHRDWTTYFYCTLCPFSTSDENELKRHNSELHPDTKSSPKTSQADTFTYQCNKCFYQSKRKTMADNHRDRCHPDDSSSPFLYNDNYKFHCHLCQYRGHKIVLMSQHLRKCHKVYTTYFYCTNCPFFTSKEGEIKCHKLEKHATVTAGHISKYQCTKCYFHTGINSNLEKHTNRCHLHDSSTPFEYNETYKYHCPMCQYRAQWIPMMVQHLEKCHRDSTTYLFCATCTFFTNDENEFERHNTEFHQSTTSTPIKYEADTSMYQCDKCFYRSAEKVSAKDHIDRCHLDDSSSPFLYNDTYKFHCHLCQYRGHKIVLMSQHLRKCHKVYTTYFYCTNCPFFTSKESEFKSHKLEKHATVTAGHNISKYQCTKCYFHTGINSNLERHTNRCHLHDSSTPFEYNETYKYHCPMCQYRAQWINVMVQHLETCHRDSTTYLFCATCTFSTNDENEFERHNTEFHQSTTSTTIKYEADTSMYQCVKCFYRSAEKVSAKDHIDRCHFDNSSSPFLYNDNYKFHCHLCQYRGHKIVLMSQHLRKCHKVYTTYFYCTNCPFFTSKESEFKSHKLEKHATVTAGHNITQYQCTKCYFHTGVNSNLERHTNRCHLHDSSTPFEYNETYKYHCPMCQYRAQWITVMVQHLEKCHRDSTTYHFCATCTFSTNDENEFERHNIELHQSTTSTTIKYEADTSMYQCVKCFYRSAEKVSAEDHIDRCHPDDSPTPFQYNDTYKLHCDLCQYRTFVAGKMVLHLKACHRISTNYYFCRSCPFYTSDESKLKLHKSETHPDAPRPLIVQCTKCYYKSVYDLKEHRRRCHPDDSFPPFKYNKSYKYHCHLCQYRAIMPKRLAQHLKLCHRDSTIYFFCTICPFNTRDKSELELHKSEEHPLLAGGPRHKCPKCYYQVSLKSNIEWHKNRCHLDDASSPFQYTDDYKFHCHLCQYRASLVQRMVRHLKMCHRDSTIYHYCSICPFSTSDKGEFESHNSELHQGRSERIAYDSNASKFQCTKCDFSYVHRFMLDKHKSLCHFDDSPNPFKYHQDCRYHCHLCQYRASGPRRMAVHVGKCHKDSAPRHYCFMCPFSTTDKSEFERHDAKVHPGLFVETADDNASKFQCAKCDFDCMSRFMLDEHKNRCHFDDASHPFQYSDVCKLHCHLCQYRERDRQRMLLHVRKCHKGSSVNHYYCTSCPFSTGERDRLSLHRLRTHRMPAYRAFVASKKKRDHLPFKCSQCFYRTNHNYKQARHIRLCHPSALSSPVHVDQTHGFHCHLCQYSSSGPVRMTLHLKTCHLISRPYYYSCNRCPFRTCSLSKIGQHKSEVHQESGDADQILIGQIKLSNSADTNKDSMCDDVTSDNQRSPFDDNQHDSDSDQGVIGQLKSSCDPDSRTLCPECHYATEDSTNLDEHKRRCHPDSSQLAFPYTEAHKFHCYLCQFRSVELYSMRDHMIDCHDSAPYWHCNDCSFSTSDDNDLKDHRSSTHEKTERSSSDIEKNITIHNIVEYAVDGKMSTSDGTTLNYQCTKCYYVTNIQPMLNAHIDRSHPEDSVTPFQYDPSYRFHCHLCQYRAFLTCLMVQHLNVCHRVSTPYFYCTICPFSTFDRSELERHISDNHQDTTVVAPGDQDLTNDTGNQLQCLACYYMASNKFSLKRHLKRCHLENGFRYSDDHNLHCPFCQFRGITALRMEQHLKVCHHDSRVYHYCTKCSFSTSDEDEFRRHDSERHQELSHGVSKFDDCDPSEFCLETVVNLTEHQSITEFLENSSDLPVDESTTTSATSDIESPQAISSPITQARLAEMFLENTSDLPAPVESTESTTSAPAPLETDNVATSNEYRCPKCHYVTQCTESFEDHTSRCHPDDSPSPFQYNVDYKFHCRLCQFRSFFNDGLTEHLEVCHRDSTSYSYCTSCPFKSSDYIALVSHNLECHQGINVVGGNLVVDECKSTDVVSNSQAAVKRSSALESNSLVCHEGTANVGGVEHNVNNNLVVDDGTKKCESAVVAIVKIGGQEPLRAVKRNIFMHSSCPPTKLRMFPCTECHFKAPQVSAVDEHMQRCHRTDSSAFVYTDLFLFRCHLCRFRADSRKEIHVHLEFCHRDFTSYRFCTYCGGDLSRESMDDYGCKCSKKPAVSVTDPTSDTSNQQNTQTLYRANGEFRCANCDFRTNSGLNLVTHMRQSHARRPARSKARTSLLKRKFRVLLTCPRCPFVTHDKSELERHKSEHSPSELKLVFCYFPSCPFQTFYHDRLLTHLKRRHFNNSTAEEFSCHLCPYKIPAIDLLVTHLKVVHHDITHQDIVKCFTGQDRIESLAQQSKAKHNSFKNLKQTKFGWRGSGKPYILKAIEGPTTPPGFPLVVSKPTPPPGTSSSCEVDDRIVLSDSEAEDESAVGSKELVESSEVSKRLKVITPASKFSCTKCDFKSNYSSNLSHHTSQCHPDCCPLPFQYNDSYKFFCGYCQFRGRKQNVVLHHLRVCHKTLRTAKTSVENDIIENESAVGSKELVESSEVSKRLKVVTPAPKFSCTKCDFKSNSSSNLSHHTSQCHPDCFPLPFQYNDSYRFFCGNCQFRGRKQNVVLHHLSVCHKSLGTAKTSGKNDIIKDESAVGSKELVQSNKVPKRRKVMALPPKFSCAKCDFKTIYMVNLNYHISQCHPDCSPGPFQYNDTDKFSCGYCEFRTCKQMLVSRHLRVCHKSLRTGLSREREMILQSKRIFQESGDLISQALSKKICVEVRNESSASAKC